MVNKDAIVGSGQLFLEMDVVPATAGTKNILTWINSGNKQVNLFVSDISSSDVHYKSGLKCASTMNLYKWIKK